MGTSTRIRAALIGGFALACPELVVAAPADLRSMVQDRTAIAAALAQPIAHCVERHDTAHHAFHGCIDWHSAVHGTWALIAYARVTGDDRFDEIVRETLRPDHIAAEARFLRRHPRFEMPYGRAWFLRLALAYRAHFKDDALVPMADDVLASMLDYYDGRTADPRSTSYGSASWALINMHDYAAATGNAAALAAVRSHIRSNFLPAGRGCDYGLEMKNFMAVCTNWAWAVSKVLPRHEFQKWARTFFKKSGGLPRPIAAPRGAHESGLNFSRSWGLWAVYRRTGETDFAESYAAHFLNTYNDPQQWRGDYRRVGHWVAQFGMLGLEPLFADGGR
jgi:hypothetical protein